MPSFALVFERNVNFDFVVYLLKLANNSRKKTVRQFLTEVYQPQKRFANTRCFRKTFGEKMSCTFLEWNDTNVMPFVKVTTPRLQTLI